MAVHLKQHGKDVFIKKVSWVDGKVEFTDSSSNAKRYNNDWFANAERSQLQHYCQLSYEEGGLAEDYSDVIPELEVYFT